MKSEILNRRPCINTRTENFHFSVSFDPHTGHSVEFFITGRGKVGQQLDTELYELSVKASKLMQGEFEDDLPRLREGDGGGVTDQRPASAIQGNATVGAAQNRAGAAQTNAFDPNEPTKAL